MRRSAQANTLALWRRDKQHRPTQTHTDVAHIHIHTQTHALRQQIGRLTNMHTMHTQTHGRNDAHMHGRSDAHTAGTTHTHGKE